MTGMLPILIAGLAAAAVLLLAVGVAMTGASGGVATRLERYARAQAADAATSGDGARESAITAGLSRVLEGQNLTARLSTAIARADLKLRPAEFLVAWAASPFVFVAIGAIFGIVIPSFQNPVALALLFALGAYFPRWYIARRQAGRLTRFNRQLPDTITLLAN